MKVEIVAHTTDIMPVIEMAAAVCYGSKPKSDYRIAMACAKSGHLSVWEHASITFHVQGVSRALLAQLSRHRHISLSVRSQRYCEEDGFSMVKPNTVWGAGQAASDKYDSLCEDARQVYRALVRKRIPKEDARMVLPNACCTELYVTMNARALIETSRLRLCRRAQWEIRELYQAMREEVRKVCPQLAGLMRPKCEIDADFPFCTESNPCGRHPTLEKVYDQKWRRRTDA